MPVNAGRFNADSMYSDKYAPWDQYPKFLRFSEIHDPLAVIDDFYSYDDPTGHFKQLKTWCYFVVSVKHYKNNRFGPGNLLGVYDLNAKLLEGLYLLLLEHRNTFPRPKKITKEQLEMERAEWYWFPDNLKKEELLDPYLPIQTAFKEISPQMFRDYLFEWIHAALSKGSIDESMTPGKVITVYEHLVKLYAAAWLIHQRETDRPALKEEFREHKEQANQIFEEVKEAVPESAIRKVYLNPSPAEKLGLKEVTSQILKYEPLVKAIIHIGTLQDPFTFFLYILIDDKRYFLNYEVNELLELTVAPVVPLFVIIESADIVQGASGQDRQFLDYALAHGFMAYQANDFSLEKSVSDKKISAKSDRDRLWAWWQGQSQLYFKGINYYVKRQEYEMALYNLHQSMEMSLLGLLQLKTGFTTTMPNFQRLISMTLLFTDQVTLFFEQLKTDHPDLHQLLWNVYPEQSRQKLVISKMDILHLMDKADNFFIIIEKLVQVKC